MSISVPLLFAYISSVYIVERYALVHELAPEPRLQFLLGNGIKPPVIAADPVNGIYFDKSLVLA